VGLEYIQRYIGEPEEKRPIDRVANRGEENQGANV
jgi:hypothetical protein